MENSFQRLTVIGLGLIGGSFAMAARERYPNLWIQGIDTKSETLQYALRNQVIDKAGVTLPTQWEEDHLIVLGSHLTPNLENLKALADTVRGKDILVSDLGSCKREIVALGNELLPGQFIGAHPMAGKEFSGIDHATSLLFAGKLFFLTPSPDMAESNALHKLESFIHGLGSRSAVVDPAEHDRMVAYVSHLPQLYSILLTNLIFRHEPAKLLSYHGGGIDDQLRLAASPYAMWGDVFRANQDNLRSVLRELIDLMEEVNASLDQPEMAEWFKRSNTMHGIFQQLLAKRFEKAAEV